MIQQMSYIMAIVHTDLCQVVEVFHKELYHGPFGGLFFGLPSGGPFDGPFDGPVGNPVPEYLTNIVKLMSFS